MIVIKILLKRTVLEGKERRFMKMLKWIKRIKDFFSGQKKTTISVNGNNVHEEKGVMNVATESGNIKIENYHADNSKGSVVRVVFFLLLIMVSMLMVIHEWKYIVGKKSNTTSVDNENVFENQYMYGNYNDLLRYDNITTAFQVCDSEFYASDKEKSKGNYVRVLVFPIESYFLNVNNDYPSEDEMWDYIEAIYNSVCISLCTEYDSKLEQVTQDQWRYVEKEKGVYFSSSFFAGEKDFVNSIVSDREKSNGKPWFVLQKCLYFGDAYIITVVLTHDGTYEEFMKSDALEDLRLKKCFQSFYQVYEKGKLVTGYY